MDVPITDRGIAHLRDLPALFDAKLYGTGVTAEGLEMLRKAAPLAKIDCRGGALLGVGGLSDSVRAEVERVVPGSAAAAAGLVPRDVITKVAGRPVGNFERLTREIARFRGGEKVVLEIERGGRTFQVDVTFGKWTKWSE